MNSAPLGIARLALLRLARERSNIFFILVFPLLLVLLIGLSFGGSTQGRVTIVGGAGAASDVVVDHLLEEGDVEVVRSSDRDGAVLDLSRGRTDAVVVLPADFDERLTQGEPADVGLAFREAGRFLEPAVRSALAAAERPHRVESLAEQLGATGAIPPNFTQRTASTVVVTQPVGPVDETFAGLDQFDLGAATQLVLFVFITTLGGAARIVEAKDLGTLRRMLAGPVSPRQIVLGEAAGRFAVGAFQAVWILVATMILFGVDWGDPLAALVVIGAFTAASAGAGLLLGAVSSTMSQASGLATLLGLTLAALGGSMAPLDIFSPTLRRIAHVTPHAWANDAFADLTRRDGGLVDVLPEVGVLLTYALVLGLVAARRLSASITET